MHSCDVCGKTGFRDDALVQFEGKGICPECKDGFFQRLREGVQPKPIGMFRRLWVVALHLSWTIAANYLILIGVNLGIRAFVTRGGLHTEIAYGFAAGATWFFFGLILLLGGSLGAAVLTVRCAARQLGIGLNDAPRNLAPPLALILITTGVPAVILCLLLLLAMFVGFLLAIFLLPYFMTIICALLYLLILKLRAARG